MDRIISCFSLVFCVVVLVFMAIQSGTVDTLEARVDQLTDDLARRTEKDGEPAPARPDQLAQLETRLAALEKAREGRREWAEALKREMGSVRPRPSGHVPAEVSAEDPVADEMSSLREDVDALLTGAGVSSEAAKRQIERLVKSSREKARAERRARWQEAITEHQEAALREFSEEEGLDEPIQTQLATILARSRKARGEARQRLRAGELTFAQMRERRDVIRKDARKAMAELLDEAQLERLREALSPRRWRGGGPI